MGVVASVAIPAAIGANAINNKSKNMNKNNLNKPSFTQGFEGYASATKGKLVAPNVKPE